MGLALSTQAAPELELVALDAACRARGLDGAELLVAGDATDAEVDALVERARAAKAQVVALRVEGLPAEQAERIGAATRLARASARLGGPVSLAATALSQDELSSWATEFARAGGRLLLAGGTQLDEMVALVAQIASVEHASVEPGETRAKTLGIAWEVRPATEDLGEASAVLFAVREQLGLVRLFGGGPEQKEQEGRGLGALLVDLALSQYAGPIVMCPSRPEVLPRWAEWLASRKVIGCGTAQEKEDARKGVVRDQKLLVDVLDVEPRDRMQTILGAYHSLGRGQTMQLTVDHDPICMYYTLESTEAEGSFAFRITDKGPEVWRAEVTKL